MADKVSTIGTTNTEAFERLSAKAHALGISQSKLIREIIPKSLEVLCDAHPLEENIRQIVRKEIIALNQNAKSKQTPSGQ